MFVWIEWHGGSVTPEGLFYQTSLYNTWFGTIEIDAKLAIIWKTVDIVLFLGVKSLYHAIIWAQSWQGLNLLQWYGRDLDLSMAFVLSVVPMAATMMLINSTLICTRPWLLLWSAFVSAFTPYSSENTEKFQKKGCSSGKSWCLNTYMKICTSRYTDDWLQEQ